MEAHLPLQHFTRLLIILRDSFTAIVNLFHKASKSKFEIFQIMILDLVIETFELSFKTTISEFWQKKHIFQFDFFIDEYLSDKELETLIPWSQGTMEREREVEHWLNNDIIFVLSLRSTFFKAEYNRSLVAVLNCF